MDRPGAYKYLRSQAEHFRAFTDKREKYLSPILNMIKPKRILELGCGEGSLGQLVKRLTGAQIFGIDYSISGLKLAKEKGVIAKEFDLNKGIPFKNNQFDLVISDQLIEHINDTDLLIKESFRILKKGAYLIIITPNLSYWFNRLLFIIGIYPIFLEASLRDKTLGQGVLKKYIIQQEAMGHIRVFNLPALVDILTNYGFLIVKKQGIPLNFSFKSKFSYIYYLIDIIFAKRASLARDIMVVVRKP